MNETNKTKYFIYCRKSSESEDRQAASIKDQLDAIQKIVDAQKLNVVGTFTEERSSKEPGRPVFNEMISRINAGEASAIFCWDNDRLSRNPIDSGNIAWMLQRGILKVINTPGRSYYPEDAGLLLSIEQGRATDFVIRLSKNVKRGLHGKAMRGLRPSGGPVGYKNAGTEKGSKTIEIDPERFPLVRRMWDMFLTGHYSVRELHKIADEQWGLKTPQKRKLGGKPLSMSHIYRILNDQFYMGKFDWIDPNTGEVVTHQGVHTPMITEREFERAQILLGAKGKPQPKTREFSYTGLGECGECHSAITAEEKNQIICTVCKHKFGYENKTSCPKCQTAINMMRNPTILKYVYYRCSKKKDRNCSQKYIRLEQFDEQLGGLLDELTINEEYVKVALDYMRDTQNLEVQDNKSIIASLQSAYLQSENHLDRLNQEYTSAQNADYSVYTPTEFAHYKKQIIAERDRIKKELADMEKRIDDSFAKAERTFNFCAMAKVRFNEGDTKTKRLILSTIGSNITLKDKKLSITLLHPFQLIRAELNSQNELMGRLEPKNNETIKGKTGTFMPVSPRMLPGQDSNLRPID